MAMKKYGLKNKLNRQLTINKDNSGKPENTFVLPPLSVRYQQFTDDEFNYVRSIYGKDLVIRKTF